MLDTSTPLDTRWTAQSSLSISMLMVNGRHYKGRKLLISKLARMVVSSLSTKKIIYGTHHRINTKKFAMARPNLETVPKPKPSNYSASVRPTPSADGKQDCGWLTTLTSQLPNSELKNNSPERPQNFYAKRKSRRNCVSRSGSSKARTVRLQAPPNLLMTVNAQRSRLNIALNYQGAARHILPTN